MASLDELGTALVNADKAGDVEAAKTLAGEIQRVRGTSAAQGPGQPLGANAGLANFAANVVGLPMQTLENAANLGLAGAGTALTAAGRPDLAPNLIQNTPGAVSNVKEMMRRAARTLNLPGLSPDNPASHDPTTSFNYDMMSRGGFIPGGMIPAAASIGAEKLGYPELAPLAAITPTAATTAYNALRAPGLATQESLNSLRDKTLADAQKAGYIIPPSAAGAGFISKRLESIGGKAAIGQQSAMENQQTTNALARQEAGLPENSSISVEALQARRDQLAAPYREVKQLSANTPFSQPPFKSPADTLEELKQARADANRQYQFYDRSADPAALAKARELSTKAEQLEKSIEAVAIATGKPGLVEELRDARKQIAKTWDVERALNVATGDVSAATLGKMVDRGKPLSGGLSVAGRFQNAYPAYAREGAAIPTPGVSKSEALASLFLGLGGYGALGLYGTGIAALPLLSGPVRSGLLFRPYQATLAPKYGPALQPEGNLPALLRQGILSQGQ